MNTKASLRLLVGGCLLLLAALLGVQGFLLWNTYQLTAATYRTELRQALLRLHDTPGYEAILDQQEQQLRQDAGLYLNRGMSHPWMRQRLRASAAATDGQLGRYIAQQARRQPLLRNVLERRTYVDLLVQRPGRSDTVLSSKARPLQLDGAARAGGYLFDMGTSSSSVQVTGPTGPVQIAFIQVLQVDVAIWRSRLWHRMGTVAAFTVLLLLAVVLVFYVVLQSALRQRQLADLRTDLVNNITHELKTPLSSLGLVLKGLQRADVQQDPARQQPLVAALARQHERLHQTVERVLASAMAGTAPVIWQELDLTRHLTRYAEHFLPTTHAVRFEVAPVPQRLRTDPAVVDTVLGNLLDNAHKYSPPGSSILVRGQAGPTHYYLTVQDQGPGIAPAHQAHIFEKFYRAPERNLHTVKGLGLGLHLSRQMAEQVGGQLTLAHSSAQGSTFLLLLPLR